MRVPVLSFGENDMGVGGCGEQTVKGFGVGMWWTLQMGVACAWVGVLDYCFQIFNALTVIHARATPGTAASTE